MKHLPLATLFLALLPAAAQADDLGRAGSPLPHVYTYTAFGSAYTPAVSNPDFQRYTFTGREAPSANGGAPMFYRNRMYSPGLGRFGRRDPVLGGDPQFNEYAFPTGNAVYYVDAMGNNGWGVPPIPLPMIPSWDEVVARIKARISGAVSEAANEVTQRVGAAAERLREKVTDPARQAIARAGATVTGPPGTIRYLYWELVDRWFEGTGESFYRQTDVLMQDIEIKSWIWERLDNDSRLICTHLLKSNDQLTHLWANYSLLVHGYDKDTITPGSWPLVHTLNAPHVFTIDGPVEVTLEASDERAGGVQACRKCVVKYPRLALRWKDVADMHPPLMPDTILAAMQKRELPTISVWVDEQGYGINIGTTEVGVGKPFDVTIDWKMTDEVTYHQVAGDPGWRVLFPANHLKCGKP